MAQDKKNAKIQAMIDPALSEVLSLLSMNVRGHFVRNALSQYVKSPEGRQFYNVFGIDLDAELAKREFTGDPDAYTFERGKVGGAQKVVGVDATSESAASLFKNFDRTKIK